MKLSALEHEADFVLLAPGFGDSPRWTLLREARVVSSGSATHGVWLARYETPGHQAMHVAGRIEEIDLEFDTPALPLEWSLDETGFASQIERIREAIAAGDVYQVNVTRPAWVTCESGAAFLGALCRHRVPRFAAWVRLAGVGEVVSASPEMLFEVDGRTIRAEPMKGTAPANQRAWLEQSTKDAAELAMITDLVRDDLNHLCVARSVSVPNARRFVELPYAVQTVSEVVGHLRDEVSVRDVLAQLHPGGSITGAPRAAARAMISALEGAPRDFYCGVLAYERATRVRASLLIRTAQRVSDTRWRYSVGGGITWDSRASDELAEVRLKLGAL